jgi:hypothetical protein
VRSLSQLAKAIRRTRFGAAATWPDLTNDEHVFDTGQVLTPHDLENTRRSAAMAALSKDDTMRLIDTCRQLLEDRARIAALLTDLPTTMTALRATLNELHRIVG